MSRKHLSNSRRTTLTQQRRVAVTRPDFGGNPLRSGTAIVDAVQEIARQNREYCDAYERDQYISNLDASDRTRKDTNDRLHQLTLETETSVAHWAEAAGHLYLMLGTIHTPKERYSELDYLKRQKPEQLTSRFVNRYFDENKDEIGNVIGQGVITGIPAVLWKPMITNTSAFRINTTRFMQKKRVTVKLNSAINSLRSSATLIL